MIQTIDGDYLVTDFGNGNVLRELRFTPTTAADPTAWFIDIGPFFDRFGPAKMAVLTSTDAGVKAIIADVSIRKWIDLQKPEVASSLTYIGSVVASVTPALQTAILTTPVDPADNLALRKLYFS